MHELRIEDLSWLRALARSLVRDAHTADDAVQDTLVVALEHEPRDPRAIRAWLASILRNVVRQSRRGDARRSTRELSSRPVPSAPSTLEVVEELALHRELVELVQSLDEPYRTTVHLRFLRGMSAKEIARVSALPVKTVHTRIERALDRLRARLDRSHGGDRNAWVVALLPFAELPVAPVVSGAPGLDGSLLSSPAASAGIGIGSVVLTMNLKVILSCALAMAIGAALYFDSETGAAAVSRGEATSEPVASEPMMPRRDEVLVAQPSAERRAVDSPPAHAVEPVEATPPAPRIHGDVRELDGRPVRDIEIIFLPSSGSGPSRVVATSTAGGEFELEVPERSGRLSVRSELYACVTGPKLDGGIPAERPIVVVAPRRRYAGTVLDESGAPIPGARVQVVLPDKPTFFFSVTLEPDGRSVHVLQPFAEVLADDAGQFRIDSVAAVPGAFIEASRDGFDTASSELAESDDLDIVLTLPISSPHDRSVFGVVLDPNGVPVEDAFVSYGYESTISGADGRFVLRRVDWVEEVTLRALVPGRLPASLEWDPATSGAGHAVDDPVRLFLGEAPLAIAGRVVDEHGDPVAGAEVWTPDVSYFGATTHSNGEKSVTGEASAEALIMGRPNPSHPRHIATTTDRLGRFRLDGLLDRGYSILAVVPSTLAASVPRKIPAGEVDVTIRLSEFEPRRVAGRLVSSGGTPLADVQIALGRHADESVVDEREISSWNDSPLPPPSFSRPFLEGPLPRTDADGRFEFDALSTERAFLLFLGDALQRPHTYRLEGASDLESLRIEATASCRFRVVLEGDPDEADAFSLARADGTLLPVFVPVSDVVISAPSVDIVGGRSGVVIGAEGSVTIVLLREGDEVRRVAVDLPAGAGHTIRL